MLSTHEWKPGDVARLTLDGGDAAIAIVRHHRDDPSPVWVMASTPFFKSVGVDNDVLVTDARPLVVIDPEDREQAERLRDEYEAYRPSSTDLTAHMQDALRSLIAPPKPPEPTGLGAVVEDADGQRWVRFKGRLDDTWAGDESNSRYADIDAVKVLSEGVAA